MTARTDYPTLAHIAASRDIWGAVAVEATGALDELDKLRSERTYLLEKVSSYIGHAADIAGTTAQPWPPEDDERDLAVLYGLCPCGSPRAPRWSWDGSVLASHLECVRFPNHAVRSALEQQTTPRRGGGEGS